MVRTSGENRENNQQKNREKSEVSINKYTYIPILFLKVKKTAGKCCMTD